MRELEKKLGYSFKNPALLQEALRHSSYANEHRSAELLSNEYRFLKRQVRWSGIPISFRIFHSLF